MKVAYVYFMLRKNQVGVETKLRRQARAIASAGLTDLELFVLNPTRQQKVEGVNFIKLRSSAFPWNYFEYAFRRYDLIARSLALEKYDYVILRYPLADPSGIEFTREYNVITEHHTKELDELLTGVRNATSLTEKLVKGFLWFQEQRYACRILQNCRGIIAVSDEIRRFELERLSTPMSSATIPNGVDVESMPCTSFKPFDGKTLDLIFLASFLRPWHGLERVIASLNHYSGHVRIQLHVVGNVRPEELKGISWDEARIHFHGPKTGQELAEMMPEMNLALSTMALYRKNLKETSALKTSEYTAMGMPFLLAYQDPDLSAVDEERRFHLSFQNDDSLLEMKEVIDFAQDMSRRRETISAYMRDYAFKHMDWRIKLKQYLDYVSSLS